MMNKNTVESIYFFGFNVQTCCFIAFLCLLAACSREVEADFYIDGKPFVSSVEQPRDTAMFQAEPGNKLRLRDMSEPLRLITDRSWKIESPNIGVITNDTAGGLELPLEEADIIKVTLCVNQSTSCATKWVRVAGDMYYDDESDNPEIKFTMPHETFTESATRTRTVKLATKNVYRADDIEIKMNGVPVAFDFDANEGIVSASVRLDPGNNTLVARATVEDIITGENKSDGQEVHIDYRSRSSSRTPSKPKEEPIYRPPSVPADKPRAAPARPRPSFDMAPSTAEVGQPILFNNLSTNTSLVRTYFWDFEDGSRSQETTPTHEYKEAGRYKVTLCINGSDNCTSKNISVFDVKKVPPPVVTAPAPAPKPEVATPKPVVSFAISKRLAKVGDEITFRNETTNTGQVEDYHWDFGDGTSSTAPNPRHSYSKAGRYTIRLCVNNREICIPKTIVVEAAPKKAFVCGAFKTLYSKDKYLPTASAYTEVMTATIQPKVDIQLNAFDFAAKTAGRITVEYYENGKYLQKVSRYANIDLNEQTEIIGPVLYAGKKYTIKLRGKQNDKSTPIEFKVSTSCSSLNNEQLSISFPSGAAFFDLKYCYL